MPEPVVINLRPEHFDKAETTLAGAGGLTASTFRYSTGVAALRLSNETGHIVLLPFQGQQIWDAEFSGRRLTMRSMFDEPVPTQSYLATYGAFFIHCGATAMGNPGPTDRHPLHGELPNAPYESAQLLIAHDGGQPLMALTGVYRHRVAFTCGYIAEPLVRLTAGSSRIDVEMAIRNLREAPMELMYLAHINFRPVDDARLVDAVPDDAEHIRLRTTAPGGGEPAAGQRALIVASLENPGAHRRIQPDRRLDPELVMTLAYPTGPDGWAHSMQVHPDGAADFVSHRPDELGHVVRWISRTGDEDALGIALPATAGPDGYTAEKSKGSVKMIAAGETFRCRLQFGALAAGEANQMQREINALRRANDGTEA